MHVGSGQVAEKWNVSTRSSRQGAMTSGLKLNFSSTWPWTFFSKHRAVCVYNKSRLWILMMPLIFNNTTEKKALSVTAMVFMYYWKHSWIDSTHTGGWLAVN